MCDGWNRLLTRHNVPPKSEHASWDVASNTGKSRDASTGPDFPGVGPRGGAEQRFSPAEGGVDGGREASIRLMGDVGR